MTALIVLALGMVLGQLSVKTLGHFVSFYVSSLPDLVQVILVDWLSMLLTGAITGVLAISLPALILKRANYVAVFYSFAGVIILLAILSVLQPVLLGFTPNIIRVLSVVAWVVGAVVTAYLYLRRIKKDGSS